MAASVESAGSVRATAVRQKPMAGVWDSTTPPRATAIGAPKEARVSEPADPPELQEQRQEALDLRRPPAGPDARPVLTPAVCEPAPGRNDSTPSHRPPRPRSAP